MKLMICGSNSPLLLLWSSSQFGKYLMLFSPSAEQPIHFSSRKPSNRTSPSREQFWIKTEKSTVPKNSVLLTLTCWPSSSVSKRTVKWRLKLKDWVSTSNTCTKASMTKLMAQARWDVVTATTSLQTLYTSTGLTTFPLGNLVVWASSLLPTSTRISREKLPRVRPQRLSTSTSTRLRRRSWWLDANQTTSDGYSNWPTCPKKRLSESRLPPEASLWKLQKRNKVSEMIKRVKEINFTKSYKILIGEN